MFETRQCSFCLQYVSFEKITQWAGHRSRCIKNPQHAFFNEQISKARRLSRKTYVKLCDHCGKQFELQQLTEKEFLCSKKHCTRSCSGQARKLTSQSKEKIRISSLGRKSWNKGICKKVENICTHCKIQFETIRCTRMFCGAICKKSFYDKQHGIKQIYKDKCKFRFNVFDYPEHFDLSLIEKHGWYKPTNRGNNLKGVSRDHRFSINDGFLFNVDPEKISHPANCNLVLHIDNQRKNKHSDLTLKELEQFIYDFNDKVPER